MTGIHVCLQKALQALLSRSSAQPSWLLLLCWRAVVLSWMLGAAGHSSAASRIQVDLLLQPQGVAVAHLNHWTGAVQPCWRQGQAAELLQVYASAEASARGPARCSCWLHKFPREPPQLWCCRPQLAVPSSAQPCLCSCGT